MKTIHELQMNDYRSGADFVFGREIPRSHRFFGILALGYIMGIFFWAFGGSLLGCALGADLTCISAGGAKYYDVDIAH